MKNTQTTIASVLLSAVLMASPIVSFARYGEDEGKDLGVSVNAKADLNFGDGDRTNHDDDSKDDLDVKGDVKGDWRNKFEERKREFKDTHEEWKDNHDVGFKTRIAMFFFGGFDLVSGRLQSDHDKLETKLASMTGISASAKSDAQAELDASQKDLDALNLKIKDLKIAIETQANASDKSVRKEEIRKGALEAKAFTKSAHEHLKKASKAMKVSMEAEAEGEVKGN